ncbi:MAG: TonB family protein [Bacteroides sp.]|nr:TonB family protein [Bacteroides sp.]
MTMTVLFIYLLKVNLALAVFYAFYRLCLSRDTFFGSRRLVLLAFLGIAFVYPLLHPGNWVTSYTPALALADLYQTILLPEITVGEVSPALSSGLSGSALIGGLYMLIALFLGIKLLGQLVVILRFRFQSRPTEKNGYKLWTLRQPAPPFSFFRWIFLNPSLHKEEELQEILTHEQAHCRGWHSVDILLSELACMVCWFNPFVWWLRKEIVINLEYLADEKVLAAGYDRKAYQYHLLHMTTMRHPRYTLMNHFRMLPLKSRIQMMNKKRSHPTHHTKYIAWIPLLFLLMLISNIEMMARTTVQFSRKITHYMQTSPPSETIGSPVPQPQFSDAEPLPASPRQEFAPVSVASTQILPETVETDIPLSMDTHEEVVFDVVEHMPQYPGGQEALMRYLSQHIRYPEQAHTEGIEGRVIAQMVIDTDGSVRDITIVRSVHPDLDREAVRVLSDMPQWIPGKQRDQIVKVRYTVPIRFMLPEKT